MSTSFSCTQYTYTHAQTHTHTQTHHRALSVQLYCKKCALIQCQSTSVFARGRIYTKKHLHSSKCLSTNTVLTVGQWVSGMVCTALCLSKHVCVYGQTQTSILHTLAHTHTHTLQIYDTLQKSVAWASNQCSQSIVGMIQSLFLVNPPARSQTFYTHSSYSSPDFCAAGWMYKLTCRKPWFLYLLLSS